MEIENRTSASALHRETDGSSAIPQARPTAAAAAAAAAIARYDRSGVADIAGDIDEAEVSWIWRALAAGKSAAAARRWMCRCAPIGVRADLCDDGAACRMLAPCNLDDAIETVIASGLVDEVVAIQDAGAADADAAAARAPLEKRAKRDKGEKKSARRSPARADARRAVPAEEACECSSAICAATTCCGRRACISFSSAECRALDALAAASVGASASSAVPGATAGAESGPDARGCYEIWAERAACCCGDAAEVRGGRRAGERRTGPDGPSVEFVRPRAPWLLYSAAGRGPPTWIGTIDDSLPHRLSSVEQAACDALHRSSPDDDRKSGDGTVEQGRGCAEELFLAATDAAGDIARATAANIARTIEAAVAGAVATRPLPTMILRAMAQEAKDKAARAAGRRGGAGDGDGGSGSVSGSASRDGAEHDPVASAESPDAPRGSKKRRAKDANGDGDGDGSGSGGECAEESISESECATEPRDSVRRAAARDAAAEQRSCNAAYSRVHARVTDMPLHRIEQSALLHARDPRAVAVFLALACASLSRGAVAMCECPACGGKATEASRTGRIGIHAQCSLAMSKAAALAQLAASGSAANSVASLSAAMRAAGAELMPGGSVASQARVVVAAAAAAAGSWSFAESGRLNGCDSVRAIPVSPSAGDRGRADGGSGSRASIIQSACDAVGRQMEADGLGCAAAAEGAWMACHAARMACSSNGTNSLASAYSRVIRDHDAALAAAGFVPHDGSARRAAYRLKAPAAAASHDGGRGARADGAPQSPSSSSASSACSVDARRSPGNGVGDGANDGRCDGDADPARPPQSVTVARCALWPEFSSSHSRGAKFAVAFASGSADAVRRVIARAKRRGVVPRLYATSMRADAAATAAGTRIEGMAAVALCDTRDELRAAADFIESAVRGVGCRVVLQAPSVGGENDGLVRFPRATCNICARPVRGHVAEISLPVPPEMRRPADLAAGTATAAAAANRSRPSARAADCGALEVYLVLCDALVHASGAKKVDGVSRCLSDGRGCRDGEARATVAWQDGGSAGIGEVLRRACMAVDLDLAQLSDELADGTDGAAGDARAAAAEAGEGDWEGPRHAFSDRVCRDRATGRCVLREAEPPLSDAELATLAQFWDVRALAAEQKCGAATAGRRASAAWVVDGTAVSVPNALFDADGKWLAERGFCIPDDASDATTFPPQQRTAVYLTAVEARRPNSVAARSLPHLQDVGSSAAASSGRAPTHYMLDPVDERDREALLANAFGLASDDAFAKIASDVYHYSVGVDPVTQAPVVVASADAVALIDGLTRICERHVLYLRADPRDGAVRASGSGSYHYRAVLREKLGATFDQASKAWVIRAFGSDAGAVSERFKSACSELGNAFPIVKVCS